MPASSACAANVRSIPLDASRLYPAIPHMPCPQGIRRPRTARPSPVRGSHIPRSVPMTPSMEQRPLADVPLPRPAPAEPHLELIEQVEEVEEPATNAEAAEAEADEDADDRAEAAEAAAATQDPLKLYV